MAVQYGVDCAIMIWNFAYWIRHNEANKMHFYDGRTWTWNTLDAFTQLFPFWTKAQVRRILKSLQDNDVIVTGNYNEDATNRKTWYAFSDSFINQHMDVLKSAHANAETSTCIDSNIYNNSSKNYKTTDYKNNAASGLKQSPSKNSDVYETTLPTTFVRGEEKEEEKGKEEEKARRAKRTVEPLCLFADSRYYDFDLFVKEFDLPEFQEVDLSYYYHAVADWSSQKGKKMKDWIATARNFMRSDKDKNKLHTIYKGLPQDAVDYLQSMMPEEWRH